MWPPSHGRDVAAASSRDHTQRDHPRPGEVMNRIGGDLLPRDQRGDACTGSRRRGLEVELWT